LKTVMHQRRKTPEEILREVEAGVEKGYLKIFLGYASGVGKTLRMFDEARRRRSRGQDVVLGATQPRMSPEAESLVRDLEVIPLKEMGQGTVIDVEALVQRHPEVCFVDGLAYNNPAGARNQTRWEDVRELVQAGIKVVASVNIQYIAELQMQVEAITGKHVTQTVPIAFISSADEIEIVDAPPLEALTRTPDEQAGLERRQRQLLKLREMALVLAADVVDHQLTSYLECHGIKQQFGAQERILVCITADSNAEEMLETARLIALRFYAELVVVNVDQPEISSVERAAVDEKLSLARAAGARVEILHGKDPISTVMAFARSRGMTQVYVGHSRSSGFWSRLFGTSVDRLVQLSRGMDVRIFPNKQ
jgi:two-component system sensor histidine kinase KdpD